MGRAFPILALLAFSSITIPAMAGPIATATAYTQYSILPDISDPTADLSAIHATFDTNVSTDFSGTGTTSETDTRGPNLFQISVTAAVDDHGQAHALGDLSYLVQLTNTSDQNITFNLNWDFSSSIGSTATIDVGKLQTASFHSSIDGMFVGDNHFCTLRDGGFQADIGGITQDQAGRRTCFVQSADSSMGGGPITIAAGETITGGSGSLQVAADAAVPEPATAFLFGLGVLSLALVRSSKRA